MYSLDLVEVVLCIWLVFKDYCCVNVVVTFNSQFPLPIHHSYLIFETNCSKATSFELYRGEIILHIKKDTSVAL